MEAKIRGANVKRPENKRTDKINFINMRGKASKIRVKTCKGFFPIEISRETIVVKRNKSVKKGKFVISAYFSRKSDISMA